MTDKIRDAIDALYEALKEQAPDSAVAFEVFITCGEYQFKMRHRYPEDLKVNGISMRNIRGEFIK